MPLSLELPISPDLTDPPAATDACTAPVPLIVTVGPPGSGKSSWAARWQATTEPGGDWPDRRVVSTDAIRAELFGDEAIQGSWRQVWRTARDRWRQAIAAARSGVPLQVAYDATNAAPGARRSTLALARRLGFFPIVGLWFPTPLAVCLARNRARSRRVPESVVRAMAEDLERSPPALEDGFDALVVAPLVASRPSAAETGPPSAPRSRSSP